MNSVWLIARISKGGKELVGVDDPRKDDLYRVPIISEKNHISQSLNYSLLQPLLWPLSHPLLVLVVVLPHSDITDLSNHMSTLFLLLHTHAFL